MTLTDIVTHARLVADDPRTGPALRELLRDLEAEAEWHSLQATILRVTADDLEHRLDVIAELHAPSAAILDGNRGVCPLCAELSPCRTYRTARGISA